MAFVRPAMFFKSYNDDSELVPGSWGSIAEFQ